MEIDVLTLYPCGRGPRAARGEGAYEPTQTAPPHLTILYRGPLSSCNYACPYCPFAKRTESAAEHAADAAALARFVDWAAAQSRPLSVFFTPWGEALVRERYQAAIVRLSQMPHVQQVAIQTNLSGKLSWLAQAERSKVGLWATYHPGEVTRERFVAKCAELSALGVRYSVGVVGKREHFNEIEALRRALPERVYLWVNAYSQGPRKVGGYYSPSDLEFLSRLDPLFEVNTRHYPTRGKACATGESVLSVDGDGTLRRCHFVPHVLGNLYSSDLERILQPRPCPRASCECHIGYVHMPELEAASIYGEGLLARIPEGLGSRQEYLARAKALFATPQ